MISTFRLYRSLAREGALTPRTAGIVLGLKALATLVEGFGVALLVPVFELVGTSGDGQALEEKSDLWTAIATVFDTLGLPMSVETLLLSVVVMVMVRQVLAYAHRVYLVAAQQHMVATLRREGTAVCLAAGIEYHDTHSTGAITNDLAQETQRAVAVAFAVVSAAGNLILTSIYMIGMALVAGWVVLAVLAGTLTLAPIMRKLLGKTRFESESLAAANRRFSSLLVERLRAIRLLKIGNAEAREQETIDGSIEQARHSTLSLAKMQAVIPLFVEPTGAILLTALFYGGVTYLGLPFELILVIILVVIRLIPVIQEIAKAIQVFLSGIGSMRFVVERFDSARDAQEDASGNVPMGNLTDAEIVFDDVQYHYTVDGTRKPALRGFSATFLPARFNAIVGPSGAGKSTLIDLIPKLRLPSSGTIRIGSYSLQDVAPATLRDLISFVPQRAQILSGSIRDHLMFGRQDLTEADLSRALELSGLKSFVDSLPQGLNTELGEDGGGLSGGQRQRLDIARAIACNASILILDEPVSNLDPESEEAFRLVLQRLRRETETTILLIAHRFSSILDADQIIVVEDGRMTAAGQHADLIAHNTWYRNAFNASDITQKQPLRPEDHTDVAATGGS